MSVKARGIGSPGARLADSCEIWDLGTKFSSSVRTENPLSYGATSPVPSRISFIRVLFRFHFCCYVKTHPFQNVTFGRKGISH